MINDYGCEWMWQKKWKMRHQKKFYNNQKKNTPSDEQFFPFHLHDRNKKIVRTMETGEMTETQRKKQKKITI